MGNADKTPLTMPQVVDYQGIYDPDYVYSAMKNFLEVNKNYDITEKEIWESRKDDYLSLRGKFDAMIHITDHITFVIVIEMIMDGRDKVVTDSKGVEHRYVDGKSKLKIKSFMDENENRHASPNPMVQFLTKIYEGYFNSSEDKKLQKKASIDVGETIRKYKELVNTVLK